MYRKSKRQRKRPIKKRRGLKIKRFIFFVVFLLILFLLYRLFLGDDKTVFVENPLLIFNPELSLSESYETEDNESLETLKKNYYIVDGKTGLDPKLFNTEAFEKENLTIKLKKKKPKVLVFHTHSHEAFADSRPNTEEDTIVGVGDELCRILEEKYGINCLHVTDKFDYIDGEVSILGAYERMEPVIRDYLKKNKSIEMVIDLHRDGVADGTRLVTDIDGKSTAQVMFFNGICRIWKNGTLTEIEGLENPYLKTNLALSYKMKKNADAAYPGFARKIYINAYRYSLHMKPLSTLIEMGAQTNTVEEEYNACEPLASVIAETILKKEQDD